ncbi:uncharacterized protein BDV17DRAFT_189916 [Aspergillus undulatus]|uniref:uncharacterized protein n=1 Tax=Aspergillus undulatus TaxID=1810928 RepID=UPI003CCE261B
MFFGFPPHATDVIHVSLLSIKSPFRFRLYCLSCFFFFLIVSSTMAVLDQLPLYNTCVNPRMSPPQRGQEQLSNNKRLLGQSRGAIRPSCVTMVWKMVPVLCSLFRQLSPHSSRHTQHQSPDDQSPKHAITFRVFLGICPRKAGFVFSMPVL